MKLFILLRGNCFITSLYLLRLLEPPSLWAEDLVPKGNSGLRSQAHREPSPDVDLLRQQRNAELWDCKD